MVASSFFIGWVTLKVIELQGATFCVGGQDPPKPNSGVTAVHLKLRCQIFLGPIFFETAPGSAVGQSVKLDPCRKN